MRHLLGEPLKEIGRQFELCPGFCQGLAAFQRHRPHDHVFAFQHESMGRMHQIGPGARGKSAPSVLSRDRRIQCKGGVVCRRVCHTAKFSTIRRVGYAKVRAARAPLPTNE